MKDIIHDDFDLVNKDTFSKAINCCDTNTLQYALYRICVDAVNNDFLSNRIVNVYKARTLRLNTELIKSKDFIEIMEVHSREFPDDFNRLLNDIKYDYMKLENNPLKKGILLLFGIVLNYIHDNKLLESA
jgi:hypothetical protein